MQEMETGYHFRLDTLFIHEEGYGKIMILITYRLFTPKIL